ncbi:PAAR domain-containing protein [Paraburkholderia sp. SOS3]|uniref:PAAR domain-containing protein n=1 Tax=Paraburkholderia sp. SOS3 TaxID=1926494 RepID=UPI0009476DCB|nr:PAAR domain-containing protein [Paraburkholderia sp. SOS3]APR35267.1 hypothetical protein BTO02_07300 [Paraburkholderia sp. SOS3]
MARQIIVVGDTLSPHGGYVRTGSQADAVDGRSIARKTDLVDCAAHGVNPIAEGDSSTMFDGLPVALEGHRASCGCLLVSRRKTLALG